MGSATVRATLSALEAYYGKPARPVIRDPFHLILWEQVAYLTPDARRAEAFAALEARVGLTAADVLAAPRGVLLEIARMGGAIAAADRADRMRDSARAVADEWGGDLRRALRLPPPRARKALSRFAMIGAPGADRILAITGTARVLPLDSNALRVLVRLGLVEESKTYAATYRLAQAAMAPALPKAPGAIVAAAALLRTHGQQLCKRNRPKCGRCPIRSRCVYFKRPQARRSGSG